MISRSLPGSAGGVVGEFVPLTAETDPKFASARARSRESTLRDRDSNGKIRPKKGFLAEKE